MFLCLEPRERSLMGMPKSKRKKRRRDEPDKPPRLEKVVRDSFTMPKAEHARLAALKGRVLKHGIAVKKSELLRAGVQLLETLGDAELRAALSRLKRVKTGRPPGNLGPGRREGGPDGEIDP
jgi:hypothetical protein